MRIHDMTWMQVEDYLAADDRCVLPLGSTEQHAYLSLGTDAILAERVSLEAAHPLGVVITSYSIHYTKLYERFYRADFASFEAVRAFAAAIRRDYRRLDVLVNNAGVWLDSEERQLSADGHEMHLQGTNRFFSVKDASAQPRAMCVITSYSIHYTKLYEWCSSGPCSI